MSVYPGQPLDQILQTRPFDVVGSSNAPDPAALQSIVLGVGKIVLADDSMCGQAFRNAALQTVPDIKVEPLQPSASPDQPKPWVDSSLSM